MKRQDSFPFYVKNFIMFPHDEPLKFGGTSLYDFRKGDKYKKYPVRTLKKFQISNIWRYTLKLGWHKEYVNPSDIDFLFSADLMTEEQFKIMGQRKSLYLLNNYKNGFRYNLQTNDRFLWLVDDFISYLEAIEIIIFNLHFKCYLLDTHQVRKFKVPKSSKTIRFLIEKMKIPFMLLMIKLYKMIIKDNKFRSFLDENISIEGYDYCLKDNPGKDNLYIGTITKQIIVLSYECISWIYDFKEKLTPLKKKVGVRSDSLPVKIERVQGGDLRFSIEPSIIVSSKIEQIIKYTFDYFYLKPEFAEKEVKKNGKK